MKIIKIPFEHRYPEDLQRIQKVLIDQGYIVSLRDCATLWDEYSDSMCAGWMCLPHDDAEVYACISLNVIKYAEDE